MLRDLILKGLPGCKRPGSISRVFYKLNDSNEGKNLASARVGLLQLYYANLNAQRMQQNMTN